MRKMETKQRNKKLGENADEISEELKQCADDISFLDRRMQEIRYKIERSLY